jgi:hypothetical protein
MTKHFPRPLGWFLAMHYLGLAVVLIVHYSNSN